MTKEKALSVLRHYQAWRRFGGPASPEAQDYPDPRDVGEAIDFAISMLAGACGEEPGYYYGG